jgi:hypothetical protein
MATRKALPDHAFMVENILSVFDSASPAEIEEGSQWYAEAWSIAMALDPADPYRAAGVIAALSPLTNWTRNVAIATIAIREGKAPGHVNQKNAQRILDGERPDVVLTALKTRAFFASIVGYGDTVCVDRHAHDIAMGHRFGDDRHSADPRPSISDRLYKAIASAYLDAADKRSVSPSTMQAATWVVWRRIVHRGTRYEHISRD